MNGGLHEIKLYFAYTSPYSYLVDGEPFWGEDRIEWVIRKLDAMGLRR